MTPTSVFRPQPLNRPPAGEGFTLLELLLVLTIIGLAGILIYPNVGNLDSRYFSIQVRQANSLLNFARRDAVVRGQPSTVRFFAESADLAEAAPADPDVIASWEGEDIELGFVDSAKQEMEIEDSIDITFFPEGGSTGGTLLMALAEQEARILIDPFTGRISNEIEED